MGYEIGTPSNTLKSFNVSIDGVALTQAQVIQLKIKWDVSNLKIQGVLVFNDLSNLVESLPIRGGNKVLTAMTDFSGNVSKEELILTDISYTRTDEGGTLVQVDLTDTLTVESMKMFNGMSWSSADMTEIIDHNETLKPSIKKSKDFTSSLEPHLNFVMPLHVSFNVVTHWLARNNNVMWFQTRDSLVIQPLDELFSRSSTGDPFMYKVSNGSYRRNIYDISTKFNNLLRTNMFQANGKVAYFNPTDKGASYEENNATKAIEDIGSLGDADISIDSTGFKHFYKSAYHIEDKVNSMWQRSAYKSLTLEILVPGDFSNNIGDVIKLDIVNRDSSTSQEVNINGEWMITEIVDIIATPDFIQRMTLNRAKFSESGSGFF